MEQNFISDSRFSMDNASWGDNFDSSNKQHRSFRLSSKDAVELVAILLTLLAAAGALFV